MTLAYRVAEARRREKERAAAWKRAPRPIKLPPCCRCRQRPATSAVDYPPLCGLCRTIRARESAEDRRIAKKLERSKLELASVDLF